MNEYLKIICQNRFARFIANGTITFFFYYYYLQAGTFFQWRSEIPQEDFMDMFRFIAATRFSLRI